MRTIITTAFLLAAIHGGAAESQPRYVAHEWGTFTSVQDADGNVLSWHPLRTAELPAFVHHALTSGKGDVLGSPLAALWQQRIETPVIYFYAGKTLKVNVSAHVSGGLITEWYPQATQIPPSGMGWDLTILPHAEVAVPPEQPGSRYFAAREANGDLVTSEGEAEKFVFYRGAGNFKTPLRVSVKTNSMLQLENTGAEQLGPLFLVSIHGGQRAFLELNGLAAGGSNVATLGSPVSDFNDKIAQAVESALSSQGLFSAEAKAMVDTWKDSWFAEEGDRVFYILPRGWTDRILPETFAPPPRQICRVMVGRAEILTPAVESQLSALLDKAQDDVTARRQLISQLHQLGRFAEPALKVAAGKSAASLTSDWELALMAEVVQNQN